MRRSNWPIVGLAVLFCASVFLPWLWFNLQRGVAFLPNRTPQRTLGLPAVEQFWFRANNLVRGHQFIEEQLSREVIRTLGTTNLVNGFFHPVSTRHSPTNLDTNRVPELRLTNGADSIRVFLGQWATGASESLVVVHHTPEICWVGSGAEVVDFGLPQVVEAKISGVSISLECRCFRFPGHQDVEIALWCTILGGENLEKAYRFRPEAASPGGNAILESDRRSRFLAISQFLRALETRSSRRGAKQFLRLSLSSSRPSATDIQRLIEFLDTWIQVQSTIPVNLTGN